MKTASKRFLKITKRIKDKKHLEEVKAWEKERTEKRVKSIQTYKLEQYNKTLPRRRKGLIGRIGDFFMPV